MHRKIEILITIFFRCPQGSGVFLNPHIDDTSKNGDVVLYFTGAGGYIAFAFSVKS